MIDFDFTHPEVMDAVRRALNEDIGAGDITMQAPAILEALERAAAE